MHSVRARLMVLVYLIIACSFVGSAQASEGSHVASFGASVAEAWDGAPFACPDGSYEWFGATPETLYCFRVAMSELSIRARLSALLEQRSIWLNAWMHEAPDLTSRPFWFDGSVYRFFVGTSLAAPSSAVVFIRHGVLD